MEEAIKIWRDTFKLNLKPGFKRDVLATVTNLELWKTILIEWKKRKWNPFKINWMLSEYERRAAKPITSETRDRDCSPKDCADQPRLDARDFDGFAKRFLSGAW